MNALLMSWRRGSVGLLLACMAALALWPALARAEDDPPGRVGRVADTRGQVWMMDDEQGEWVDVARNRPLTTGDRLATDAGGRLTLQIGSTTVRLDERSDLEIRRLDDDRIELSLNSGSAAVRVRELEIAPEFELHTPAGRFMPRGIALYRVDVTDRATQAQAMGGEVQFDSSDSSLSLRNGQRAEFWFDESDRRTHYSWAGLPRDEFDRWVRDEDARDQRQARRYVSPEMTGAEDLDRYGQWDTHPEYGTVWYPSSVQVGWAPYRHGHWVHMRPWGWTWVDDAPWGFAPFHYGRWVNWHGRWGWVPGTYVRRPVYAPAMVAWVGGPRLSVGLSIGAGPAVGWVPLAPREVYVPAYRYSPRYWGGVNQPYGGRPQPPRPGGPREPVMYTNQGVPGGVTVVSSNALTQRRPIAQMARADDDQVRRALREPRAVQAVDAPPAPAMPARQPRGRADGDSGRPQAPFVRGQNNAGVQGPGPTQVLRAPTAPAERGAVDRPLARDGERLPERAMDRSPERATGAGRAAVPPPPFTRSDAERAVPRPAAPVAPASPRDATPMERPMAPAAPVERARDRAQERMAERQERAQERQLERQQERAQERAQGRGPGHERPPVLEAPGRAERPAGREPREGRGEGKRDREARREARDTASLS